MDKSSFFRTLTWTLTPRTSLGTILRFYRLRSTTAFVFRPTIIRSNVITSTVLVSTIFKSIWVILNHSRQGWCQYHPVMMSESVMSQLSHQLMTTDSSFQKISLTSQECWVMTPVSSIPYLYWRTKTRLLWSANQGCENMSKCVFA